MARRNFILNHVPGDLGRRQCVPLTVSRLFYNAAIWDTGLYFLYQNGRIGSGW